MSPKTADPAVRVALIEHAARLIAEEGREALTLRRLAAEVGTSTMAVYTHFGGMDDLRRAVRSEGFARLAQHLGAVEATDDPVADLVVLGSAYHLNGTTNPNLYRVMFMERALDADDADMGIGTFETLVDAVRRCIAARRFHDADPVVLANQLWATSHGVVALQLARMLSDEDADECLRATALNLLTAFGDDPAKLRASYRRARPRLQLD